MFLMHAPHDAADSLDTVFEAQLSGAVVRCGQRRLPAKTAAVPTNRATGSLTCDRTSNNTCGTAPQPRGSQKPARDDVGRPMHAEIDA